MLFIQRVCIEGLFRTGKDLRKGDHANFLYTFYLSQHVRITLVTINFQVISLVVISPLAQSNFSKSGNTDIFARANKTYCVDFNKNNRFLLESSNFQQIHELDLMFSSFTINLSRPPDFVVVFSFSTLKIFRESPKIVMYG